MTRVIALVCLVAVGLASVRGLGTVWEEEPSEEGTEAGEGELWAVLLAGSYGWFNYRHQADVCHAYQILHQHGVPDDHIITMMVDDLAHNRANPTPGVIINRPDGPNVYEGVPKDYTGMAVTPENFLKVLSGNATGLKELGSGKVVKSGPKDRVFVNLVDHGAPGIFAFPRSFMHAKNFSDVILAMHRDKKFGEMMIYMESCESGSMFQNLLPDDVAVYAVSAANATQPSFACYRDDHLHTFLGDVFSVKWMEDTDRENTTVETLENQYDQVKKEVNMSHVLQWGQLDISSQKVSTFLGNSTPGDTEDGSYGPFPPFHDPCLNSSVSSVDVAVAVLQSYLDAAQDLEETDYWQQEMQQLQQQRLFVEETMRQVALKVTGDEDFTDQLMSDTHHLITRWHCYQNALDGFHLHCFNLGTNPYALRQVHTLLNLCEHGYEAVQIEEATSTVCTFPPVNGIN